MQDTAEEPEMSEAAGAEDRRLGHLRVFGRLGPELNFFRDRHLPDGGERPLAHHRFRTRNDGSPTPQPPSNKILSRTPAFCTIHHPSRLLVGGRFREIDLELGCHLGLHHGLRETTRNGLLEIFRGDAATWSTPPRRVVTVRWV